MDDDLGGGALSRAGRRRKYMTDGDAHKISISCVHADEHANIH